MQPEKFDTRSQTIHPDQESADDSRNVPSIIPSNVQFSRLLVRCVQSVLFTQPRENHEAQLQRPANAAANQYMVQTSHHHRTPTSKHIRSCSAPSSIRNAAAARHPSASSTIDNNNRISQHLHNNNDSGAEALEMVPKFSSEAEQKRRPRAKIPMVHQRPLTKRTECWFTISTFHSVAPPLHLLGRRDLKSSQLFRYLAVLARQGRRCRRLPPHRRRQMCLYLPHSRHTAHCLLLIFPCLPPRPVQYPLSRPAPPTSPP